jgi:hypothetical protein
VRDSGVGCIMYTFQMGHSHVDGNYSEGLSDRQY